MKIFKGATYNENEQGEFEMSGAGSLRSRAKGHGSATDTVKEQSGFTVSVAAITRYLKVQRCNYKRKKGEYKWQQIDITVHYLSVMQAKKCSTFFHQI